MRRLRQLSGLSLLLGTFALVACDASVATAPTPGPMATNVSFSAHADAPGSPTPMPFSVTFDDLNPCSGLVHTVTISGTSWVHSLPSGDVVIHSERTITTDTGFEGRGQDSFVANGDILRFQLNDMLTHPSGDRIRAHFVLVIDLSTGTQRVLQGSVECLGG